MRFMFKYLHAIIMAATFCALTNSALAAEPAPILGMDADACAHEASAPAALVHVGGFKDRTGIVRIELYSDHADDFLRSPEELRKAGHLFRRIDVPTPAHGPVDICISLPSPGRFTLAVLHDRNKNGHLDIWTDGFGFPGNPRLGWSKPKASQAYFMAGSGLTHIDVTLNYIIGLGARPVSRPAL